MKREDLEIKLQLKYHPSDYVLSLKVVDIDDFE